jgi:hypothetical protein
MPDGLSENDLEIAYELIAAAVDRAGAERESLFLAKLALALANQLGDTDQVKEAIGMAESDLEGGSAS